MKVLWFDPGGTTGWATYSCTEMASPNGLEYYNERFLTGELVGIDYHIQLEALIDREHSELGFVLGYEGWHTQRNKNDEARDNVDWMACEYIGVIKLAGKKQKQIDDRMVMMKQLPNRRKFIDRRKLEIFNLWSVTVGQKDARSAAQHLLTYLIDFRKYPPIMKRLQEGLLDK